MLLNMIVGGDDTVVPSHVCSSISSFVRSISQTARQLVIHIGLEQFDASINQASKNGIMRHTLYMNSVMAMQSARRQPMSQRSLTGPSASECHSRRDGTIN